MIESRCGLLYSDCPVKSCCEQKGLQHCGECDDFVCPLLHTFAYDMGQSDHGARIEQCKRWRTVR